MTLRTPVQVAVFASGNGSNAQQIIDRFQQHPLARVALVVCDQPGAFVLQRAATAGVSTVLIDTPALRKGEPLLTVLSEYHIGFIVLAGFMRRIPEALVQAFTGRMVNIHPALLPAYGGKGMYGDHVHIAVIAAGETESGITIHYVNEQYDEGAIIFQARCAVLPEDTPESLAARIHTLEHTHYPVVIEQLLQKLITAD